MFSSKLFAAVLLLSLLACCSCGGSAEPTDSDSAAHSSPQSFAFPAPSRFADLRIAQSSYGTVLSTEYGPGLGALNVADDPGGNRLSFGPLGSAPELANCAYAVYRVPLNDVGDLRIDFTWYVTPEAGSMYIGLGNQSSDRWDWTAKFDATEPFEPGAVDDYLAQDSSLLITLLILPSDGAPQLDYFHVTTSDASGWQFVQLTQVEYSGTWDPRSSFDTEIVNGNPAILYRVKTGTGSSDYELNLATSATPAGADLADWTINSLDASQFAFADLEGIGSGFGIFDALDSKYYYSPNPAGPYAEETLTLTTNGNPVPFQRCGDIGGMPAIAYFYEPDVTPDNLYLPRYYASDSVSGGTWTDSEVSLTNNASSVILPQQTVSNLLEHDGKPVFAFCDSVLGMVVASADQAIPADINDWTVTPVDGGNGGRLNLFHAGSTLTLCDGSIMSNPDSFIVHQLTGADITQTADWTTTLVDSLNLGDVSNWGFGHFGSAVAAWPMYTNLAGNTLGGTSDPVMQYTSGSPSNLPEDWQAGVLASDIEPYNNQPNTVQFVDADGQPAYAYWYGEESGSTDPDARGRARLVWAHYVP